ncbi:MAG: Gfo/Idh/MocA family protein [Armatimonadota bacterium]
MDKVRVGFVGVGGMGQCSHLRNYATLPDYCEVVAISEVRANHGQLVASKYGVKKVYTNTAEMLANEKLDALVASQQFTRHGVVLPELYAAGIPVFTEKPLAGNVAVGEQLLKTLAGSKSWHMVGYHKRSDPATMAGKAEIDRLLSTGELGARKYVRLLMPAGDWVANGFFDMVNGNDPWPALESDPSDTEMDKDTFTRYWEFVNYYVHQINMMRHLIGSDYHVTYADPSGVLLAVQGDNGVCGTIEMTPYQTSIDWQEENLVCFEHGYVRVKLPAPVSINRAGTVEIFRDPSNGVTPEFISPVMPTISAMRQQAINFCRAVRGEIAPLTTAEEALKDMHNCREYIRLKYGQ